MDELWGQLTRGEPTLRWFARQPSGSGIAGGVLHSPLGLKRLVHNLRPSWDMYFGINRTERRGTMRICASDVTHWQTVLLDIDPLDGPSSPLDALAVYLERASALLGLEVPALVVDSGRGVQAHIRLTPYECKTADDRMAVRSAVGALLRQVGGSAPVFGCKLDMSCSDLARVARMPQTINHKTGRWTKLLLAGENEKLRLFDSVTTGTEGLPERILALAPVASHKVDKRPVTDGLRWQQVWSRLTATAQKFLESGVSYPGRHAACVAAVKSLQENGVPQNETWRVVEAASDRCTPPLEPCEALRIITASYR